MKNEFIITANVMKFNIICSELTDESSLVGPSLAIVTGSAGRGKTEAARRFATQTSAVYLPPLNIRTPAMILREIAFELGKTRPNRSEISMSIIGKEMAKERRLIIVDEADLLSMQVLEMLRNLNERLACPVLFIGEDALQGRIEKRRRIASRMRYRFEFGPITQADIFCFFEKALMQQLTPEATSVIFRYSGGEWRPIIALAFAIDRAMRGNGIKEITRELVKDVIKRS